MLLYVAAMPRALQIFLSFCLKSFLFFYMCAASTHHDPIVVLSGPAGGEALVQLGERKPALSANV